MFCYCWFRNEYGAQLAGKCLVPLIMMNPRHAISRLTLTTPALIEANDTDHFRVICLLNGYEVIADEWS